MNRYPSRFEDCLGCRMGEHAACAGHFCLCGQHDHDQTQYPIVIGGAKQQMTAEERLDA